jgi:citrate synthase
MMSTPTPQAPPDDLTPAPEFLTRSEAVELLEIKLQTLYAYVSRGWIRSIAQRDGRQHLYLRKDVERMRLRAAARSGHAPVAAAAMRWGEPIMRTALTRITALGPEYRGKPAIELARKGYKFEDVVNLFWNRTTCADSPWRPCARTLEYAHNWTKGAGARPNCETVRFFADIALQFQHERRRRNGRSGDYSTTEEGYVEASGLVATFAQSLSCLRSLRHQEFLTARPCPSIAEIILSGVGVAPASDYLNALNAALVLCVDHELAQQTFVARIAASAGADIGECVAAAILTQTGLTSLRSYECAENLLRACRSAGQARRLVKDMWEKQRCLPGFNHPLYPNGDPRATFLIDIARQIDAVRGSTEPLLVAIDAAADLGCLPSLEVGLTVLSNSLGLPIRSALGLFIIARSAGWAGHIIEQRASKTLIRPRADYQGSM